MCWNWLRHRQHRLRLAADVASYLGTDFRRP